jgi:hypothetical protein
MKPLTKYLINVRHHHSTQVPQNIPYRIVSFTVLYSVNNARDWEGFDIADDVRLELCLRT